MRLRLASPLLTVALTLSFLATASGASAQTKLLGAEEALRRSMPTEAVVATLTPEAYRQRVEEYAQSRKTLPPEEAGRQWYELLVLGRSLDYSQMAQIRMDDNALLKVVPDPQAWPTIAAQLRANAKGKTPQNQADRLLAAVFADDASQQYAIIEGLFAQYGPSQERLPSYFLLKPFKAAAERLGDPAKISRVERAEDEMLRSAGSGGVVTLPDYVSQYGAARAEPMIVKALHAPSAVFTVRGTATKALVKRLALREMARLKKPKWGLIESADDLDLYEAMAKRFPKGADEYRAEADRHAFFAYVAQGKRDRALAVAMRGGTVSGRDFADDMIAVRAKGQRELLAQTLVEVVRRNPMSGYLDLALVNNLEGTGATRLVATLKAAVATQKRPAKRAELESRLAKVLLAMDRLDEAFVLLRRPSTPVKADQYREAIQAPLTLLQLGTVAGKPAWIEEGMRRLLNPPAPPEDYFPDSSALVGLGALPSLLKAKDWARAERIVFPRLRPRVTNPNFDGDEKTDELVALAGIYHRAGRPKDVRLLLDRATTWGSKDVSQLLDIFDPGGISFGTIAGSALIATGERAKGIEILRAAVRLNPQDDDASRLLAEEDAGAITLFQTLSDFDPFEERPLIWMAHAHLKQGRIDEAERTIRRAIAIDPSDGEQPHDRRMAAYAVLADVLKAQGKSDEERSMRNVVAAIRLAERADAELEAGLLLRSTKTYANSLTLFGDAYCIQSRLAVQLASQGRFEEAERHYRRAYELMPDSFGRVESHCFGCEGAFSGERMQKIAENVFTRLAQEQPLKPQVHYLLGYLRASQGRAQAALPHFRQAVTLDPDYLNAWEALRGAATGVPGAEGDVKRATDAVIRLDPLARHTEQPEGSLRLRYVRAREVLSRLPSVPTRLYPLPRSTRATGVALNDSLVSDLTIYHESSWGGFGYRMGTKGAAGPLPRDADDAILGGSSLQAAFEFNRMVRMMGR